MKQALKFKNLVVLVEFDNNVVSQIVGNELLSKVVRSFFEESITFRFGSSGDLMKSFLTTLSPGETGYVKAVLLNEIQSYGISLISLDEFDCFRRQYGY